MCSVVKGVMPLVTCGIRMGRGEWGAESNGELSDRATELTHRPHETHEDIDINKINLPCTAFDSSFAHQKDVLVVFHVNSMG